jgi:hypothetical protein
MSDIRTFSPGFGTGVTISTTTTSSNTAIRSGTLAVCVTNTDSTNNIYFRTCAASTDVATAADYLVLPGQQVSVSKQREHGFIAVIAAAGTPSVHVITGDGI